MDTVRVGATGVCVRTADSGDLNPSVRFDICDAESKAGIDVRRPTLERGDARRRGDWLLPVEARAHLSQSRAWPLCCGDLELQGTVTFNADGSYTKNLTSKAKRTYTFDAACLQTYFKKGSPPAPPASCEELSMPANPSFGRGPATCSGDTATACTCLEQDPEASDTSSGTYVVTGNTLTMTNAADATMSTLEFCVDGNQGRFKNTEAPTELASVTWIGTKQ